MKTSILSSVVMLCLVLLAGCGPGASDYSYGVAQGYQVFRANSIDVSVIPIDQGGNAPTIPRSVLRIAWNERYVIAEQQPYTDANDPSKYPGQPEKELCYWILDTQQPRAFGPYDKTTFDLKKKELKLPEAMELKDVRSYVKPADYQ